MRIRSAWIVDVFIKPGNGSKTPNPVLSSSCLVFGGPDLPGASPGGLGQQFSRLPERYLRVLLWTLAASCLSPVLLAEDRSQSPNPAVGSGF